MLEIHVSSSSFLNFVIRMVAKLDGMDGRIWTLKSVQKIPRKLAKMGENIQKIWTVNSLIRHWPQPDSGHRSLCPTSQGLGPVEGLLAWIPSPFSSLVLGICATIFWAIFRPL